MTADRAVAPGETFVGPLVSLRPVRAEDCCDRYVAWLEDPQVNRYLETRWTPQSLETVRDFVAAMIASPDSYLFAIVENGTGVHVGNIKVGPINRHHGFADVSYFIGEREKWGRGYAAEAIRLAARIAFGRLGVRRLQAGVPAGNVASARALEKAGFRLEARMGRKFVCGDGFEDHLWYVRFTGEEATE